MANHHFLTLHSVSFQLPDGTSLFRDLNEQFDQRPTGLVGRNGVGKSVLARMLAGLCEPSSGRCTRSGSVHYLAQRIVPQASESVADLAGVGAAVAALRRIEAGSTRVEDFEAVGERWDIAQRLQQMLADEGLSHLGIDTPATSLSGGEATRVALLGAFLSDADFLILDEPSNHLDMDHRRALRERLTQWRGGLVVVSHDRELLASMQRIVELSSLGLRSYGGGYAFYAQAREQERAHAQVELEHSKAERRREERALAAQQERLQRRQARGARQAATENQAPILLGLRKSNSERTSGRLHAQHEAMREALAAKVRAAAAQIEHAADITVFAPVTANLPQQLAALRALELPYLRDGLRTLDLVITRGQRIGVVGPNGSGKSTLLKVLAGVVPPRAGVRRIHVRTDYLDQQLSLLDPQRSLLEQMLRANRASREAELRARLALLDLDANRIARPAATLSGGERIKAALALALYGDQPAQILLLDEPDNHLDLASLRALESMLRQYRGALVVVSHDAGFLAQLELTHRLAATDAGWRLEAWPSVPR